MKYSGLTEQIIGAAHKVHNGLGFGFLEKVYQNALMIELQQAGLSAEKEASVNVYYNGEVVGDYVADIIVERKVVLELKAVSKVVDKHEVQLVNYLKATGIEVGLLINFGHSVEIRRKVCDRK